MIIERITSVHVIPPRAVVKQVAVGRISRTVTTVHSVGTGHRQTSDGATGGIRDVTYEDIDIGVYSPRDQIVYAPQLQVGRR